MPRVLIPLALTLTWILPTTARADDSDANIAATNTVVFYDIGNDEIEQGGIAPQERVKVGPPAIQLQASLESARDQLQGMRTQLNAAKGASNPASLYQPPLSKFDRDLKDARSLARELDSVGATFPEIRGQGDYQKLQSNLKTLSSAVASWKPRLGQGSYWTNPKVVSSDLASLDKHLEEAIKSADDFNSSLGIESGD